MHYGSFLSHFWSLIWINRIKMGLKMHILELPRTTFGWECKNEFWNRFDFFLFIFIQIHFSSGQITLPYWTEITFNVLNDLEMTSIWFNLGPKSLITGFCLNIFLIIGPIYWPLTSVFSSTSSFDAPANSNNHMHASAALSSPFSRYISGRVA